MHKKLLSFIGILVFYSAGVCLGQSKLVSVNPLTGTATVAIPLYNISAGSVSVPVEVVYSATGVRPKDVEGTAGMGWQLVAGGSVSRQVRGLPDDIKADNSGNARLGWMHSTNQSTINSFTITNNGSTCSDETNDIDSITTNFGNLSDTEPDLFYVNAPGLSCELVYDNTISNFRTIPYQDLVVTYTTNDTTGIITSFTIINDKGTKYIFNVPESVTETTTNPAMPINYFKNMYNQYQHGITYDDSWFLSSVTDATGRGVTMSYDTAISRSSTDSVNLFLGGLTAESHPYQIQEKVKPQVLNQIGTTNAAGTVNQQLTFTWTANNYGNATYQTVVSSITGMGDVINFVYSWVPYSGDATNYTRLFLRQVTDSGCGSPLNYQFAYNGETPLPPPYEGSYTTVLADSISKKFDYWGYDNHIRPTVAAVYVNPSNSNFQRYAICASTSVGSEYPYTIGVTSCAVDTVNVKNGSLSQIIYPQGGTTTLVYQSNSYLDSLSGTTNYGGGIRIGQIIDYDGISTANNIVRNYSYVNSSGLSYGKPISLPAFAFTIPYTGGDTGQALWAATTAISDHDISPEDHTIMYSMVTASQPGAGKVVYQYYVPATNWNSSAKPGCSGCNTADWAPTKDYIGRTSCSLTFGQLKNDIYSYPFAPNTNYDFERGLLQKVTTYNTANQETSESDYTYQRSYSTATAIPALKFDYNMGSSQFLAYSKYTVYTNTSELTSKVVKKTFDSNTLSLSQQSTVNYTYGSSYHKLLTQQKVTNSDNSVLYKNISYTKDYTAVADSGSNVNVTAIYKLIKQNINIPVETWSQILRGGTTYTTTANLNLFSASTVSGNTLYLPSQQFNFIAPDGDSAFTPFTISGQTATWYAGYQTLPVANYTHYDYYGTLQTMDDGHRHEQASLKDYYSQQPNLTATNAAINEIAFNDFDGSFAAPANTFTLSGTTSYVTPGHTGKGAAFGMLQTLSAPSMTKNAQSSNYIFSAWINSGSNTGTLSLTVTLGGSPFTASYAHTGNTWQYFEWKIPVSASTFAPSITTSANIDIDDIILYPETSEVTTASHDSITHFQTAVTNTNGISTYYSYDTWGRPTYIYDRYKNILKKETYVMPGETQSASTIGVISASTSGDVPFTTSTPITFGSTGPSSCIAANTTYIWNFGDGSPLDTVSGDSPPHTYADSGTYVVQVTVKSPVLGTFKGSKTIDISVPSVTLSYSNFTTSHGVVVSMNFYQGGVLKYSATPDNMSVQPLQGPYVVQVAFATNAWQYNPAEPTLGGYQSIALTATGISACQNYSSSYSPYPSYYTFSVDLSHVTSLAFSVSTSSCP